MAYRCDQAVYGGHRDPIRCKVSGSVCAHQKMCMMEGRIVLTDNTYEADGNIAVPAKKTVKKAAAPAKTAKAPAKKTAAKKTTGGKKG